MGNRGKVEEQLRARELRADAWTLQDIAEELGVARSSVSRWVRDVDFEPRPRRRARRRGPNKLQRAKAAEIERYRVEGIDTIGRLTDRELLMAGLGLYAGDGAKGDRGAVHFANSNPALIAFFCTWFRRFFDVDEQRLRVRLYLHEHLDVAASTRFWHDLTGIPESQFTKPYRAVVDETIRHSKHVHGCCHVRYSSSSAHRKLIGLMNGLILVSSTRPSGVAQLAAATDC